MSDLDMFECRASNYDVGVFVKYADMQKLHPKFSCATLGLNWLVANSDFIDWDWLVTNLLTNEGQQRFTALFDEAAASIKMVYDTASSHLQVELKLLKEYSQEQRDDKWSKTFHENYSVYSKAITTKRLSLNRLKARIFYMLADTYINAAYHEVGATDIPTEEEGEQS